MNKKEWIYCKEPYTYECPKCFKRVTHKYKPKICPNCGERLVGFIDKFGRQKSQ